MRFAGAGDVNVDRASSEAIHVPRSNDVILPCRVELNAPFRDDPRIRKTVRWSRGASERAQPVVFVPNQVETTPSGNLLLRSVQLSLTEYYRCNAVFQVEDVAFSVGGPQILLSVHKGYKNGSCLSPPYPGNCTNNHAFYFHSTTFRCRRLQQHQCSLGSNIFPGLELCRKACEADGSLVNVTVETPKSRITALVGQDVHMECYGSALPVPRWSWKRNFRELVNSPSVGYYTLPAVQSSQSGLYSCHAANSQEEMARLISVVAVRPLSQTLSLSETGVALEPRQWTLVRCSANDNLPASVPSPSCRFTWFLDGTIAAYHTVAVSSTFSVLNVTGSQKGLLQCRAERDSTGETHQLSLFITRMLFLTLYPSVCLSACLRVGVLCVRVSACLSFLCLLSFPDC